MIMMKMNFSLLFSLVLCTASFSHGLSLNSEVRNSKNAATLKNGRAIPVQSNRPLLNTLDAGEMSADDGDDSSLFYSDGALSDEKDSDQSLLDTLLLDVIQGTNGSTEGDLSKCQEIKPQIAEICLAKFVQRTRYRPEWDQLPTESADKTTTPVKRLSSTLASPQQICCELKITYMRCMLTNLNFVCPLTEFNGEYERVKGKLTERVGMKQQITESHFSFFIYRAH